MKMTWREQVQKTYQEILAIEPTHEEIQSFAKEHEQSYGVVAYTHNEETPLSFRLHDTWKLKRGGRLHIDVVSGEFHLMLDKTHASMFLDFVKVLRQRTTA